MGLTLREQAEKARVMYHMNEISREEMERLIKPYVDEVNKKAVELAKKHGVKPRKVSVSYFVR